LCDDPGQHFTRLLSLLFSASTITVKPRLPPILSFLYLLLTITAAVISATAVVVTEHLEWPIFDEAFTAFLALSHARIPPFFNRTQPLEDTGENEFCQ